MCIIGRSLQFQNFVKVRCPPPSDLWMLCIYIYIYLNVCEMSECLLLHLLGERKRKILCKRESDHTVVSDQRCHGLPRPAAVAEPCNTDCELRYLAS